MSQSIDAYICPSFIHISSHTPGTSSNSGYKYNIYKSNFCNYCCLNQITYLYGKNKFTWGQTISYIYIYITSKLYQKAIANLRCSQT